MPSIKLNFQALGKATPWVVETVSPSLVGRFCEATGDENPWYLDAQMAAASPTGRLAMPPTLPNSWRQHKTDLLVGELQYDFAKGLHGEEIIEVFRPISVGDRIRYCIRVADMGTRQTRSYGEMGFFRLDTECCAEDGALVARVSQSFFVRASEEEESR